MPTPPPALPGSLLPQTHTQYAHHLFTTPIFPDCTVTTLKRTFQLHRAILAPRCEFFFGCFSGLFSESSCNSVTMNDDDPDVLARMLQWLYTLEFPASTDNASIWTANLDLWMAADKYGLTLLMEQCVEALLATAEKVASEHDGAAFRASATDFVDMMGSLFTEAPDREDVHELRAEILGIMAPMIARFIRVLPVLEELMVEIPGFAVVLVETLSKGSKESALMSGISRRRFSDSGSSASGRSRTSGGSRGGSTGSEARVVKAYIPMNEDSEDEMM